MTTDQRAALKRVRQVVDEQSACEVYQVGFTEAMRQLQADESLLARAYLTEHPADDDEPPSMVELEELFADPLFPPVERDGKRFAFVNAYVEIQTKRQLRQLQEALHP